MSAHWRYFKYVAKHKWFVLLAGMGLGVPLWSLIWHDWDKFTPSQWFPYARFFYGPKGKATTRHDKTGYYKPTDTGDAAFDFAWLLHQKHNRHHWQWWVLPEDDGGTKILPMPDKDRREMLADWMGAGRAQGKPDTLAWYQLNRGRMQLHPRTRQWIEFTLGCEVDAASVPQEYIGAHG